MYETTATVKEIPAISNFLGVDPTQAGLKIGILTAVIFPLVMILFIRKIKATDEV